jgi:ABC transporter fused permease/ATP-binding protein
MIGLNKSPSRRSPGASAKARLQNMVGEAKALFDYVRPHRIMFLTGIVCLTAASAMTLCFPFLAGSLIDAATHPEHRSSGLLAGFSLAGIVGLMLLTVALQGGLQVTSSLCTGSAGQRAVTDFRRRLYARVINLPMTFFSQRRIGELITRISSDVALVESAVVEIFPQAFRQFMVLICGLGLILATSPKLTLTILLVLPVLVVLAVVFAWQFRRLARGAQDRLAETGVIVDETFHAIASVKAYTNEAFEIARYEHASEVALKAALSVSRWRALFIGFMPVLSLGNIALVMWFGTRLLERGEITVGELTRFTLCTVFIAGAMAQTADLFTRFQRAMGATSRAHELLREAPEPGVIPGAGSVTSGSPLASRSRGDVHFEAVDFEYPSRRGAPVLREISLHVRPGEKVALVGPSGAGKSTLAALLLRFYEPQAGRIKIDGRDTRECPLPWLRRQIAIVPQDVLLFGGTIAENIRYGRPEATLDEVQEAARLGNAHDFIAALPENYATLVGDRGVKLSGGQRQRIAIARAILKNPPILVLDEATSSLDSESERLVQNALERLMRGRTTLIIAHRLATVRHADRIVVLEAGRIVEQGTHDELVAAPAGLYRKLSTLQFDRVSPPHDPSDAPQLAGTP